MTILQPQIDRLAVARRSYERAELALRAPLEELYRLVCGNASGDGFFQFPTPEKITAALVREWHDEIIRKAEERYASRLARIIKRAHEALDEVTR